MKIERVDINTLKVDKKNVRRHGKRNLEAIRASISKFDQVEPLIVQKSTNRIIGGNGRFSVLKEMNQKEVDVVFLDIDDTKASALSIALNRTAELAEWDDDALAKQLLALEQEGFGLGDMGFDAFEPNIGDDDLDKNEKEHGDESLKIVVECANLEDLDDLFRELNDRGFKVKR